VSTRYSTAHQTGKGDLDPEVINTADLAEPPQDA